MDFLRARRAMVANQLRPGGVADPAVLAAFAELPRERFVPSAFRDAAYSDAEIPLGRGRWLPPPLVAARLIEAVGLTARKSALVVGAGTGYMAVASARLASAVFALESDSDLLARASALAAELGADAVVARQAPLETGDPEQAPFDAILFCGAAAWMPPALLAQLAEGGVLAAVMMDGDGSGRATLFHNRRGVIVRHVVFDAFLRVLPEFAAPETFVFPGFAAFGAVA